MASRRSILVAWPRRDVSRLFVPCTPYGCIYLLEKAGVKIEGANAVVLGRSNIVGMPAALLLIGKNATVTVCHSRTKDLPGVVRQADILIAAIGKTEMVRGDWIKPGAAIIDVGINSVPDATKKSGHRLVGDVMFRGSQRSGRVYHTCPRRRGSDDDCHVDEEYAARGTNPEPIGCRCTFQSRRQAGLFYNE